jgi:aerobic carbon-monoxide dehydrogenase large subunit
MIGFRYGGWEYARVQVHPTGTVTVFCGTADQGQGHATSYAQIAADALGVPIDDITVVEGDTGRVYFGTGTFNSRSIPTGGVAIKLACDRVVDKALRVAAHALGTGPGDIEHDIEHATGHDPERRAALFRIRDGLGAAARMRRTGVRRRRRSPRRR